MGTTDQSAIICPACGKWHALKPEYAGKRLKCKCGEFMVAPASAVDTGNVQDDLYDVTPPAPAAAPSPAIARPTINKDDVLARVGKLPPKPPTTEQLVEQARAHAEAGRIFQDDPLRDVILPIAIIAVGLGLSAIEAMTVGKAPAQTISQAIPRVGLQAFLSVIWVLGGMLLAMLGMEVCFIGSFKKCILRFIAIAIGPASVYALLVHWIGGGAGGELGGPLAATFGSILAYAALFWLLLRLDLKDTTICVVMVFILVTFAHYSAFKLEQAMKGSML